MNAMFDTEGTVLFPYQTEITLAAAVFSAPVRNIARSITGQIREGDYLAACPGLFLLVIYLCFIAGVILMVMPWVKALIVAKFAVSPWWALPVKRLLLWGLGRVVGAIHRKMTQFRRS